MYGFMSGFGLILIVWGLTSITSLPSGNTGLSIGFALLGVLLFAYGSCREAYLRGGISMQVKTRTRNAPSTRQIEQTQTEKAISQTSRQEQSGFDGLTSEQIKGNNVGPSEQEYATSEQENQTET